MNSLWPLLETLRSCKYIDLTHTFHAGIPHAPDMPDEVSDKIYDFSKDGFQAHLYKHVGQWGTHVDPPVHYVENGRTIDQIDVSEMILPLVLFDCELAVLQSDDFLMGVDFVQSWENRNGRIPKSAFAVMKTGWSKRWPSQERMLNIDANGVTHFPGWGRDAVEFLINDRSIIALGHETTDTDGGISTSKGDYSVESRILHANRYQIELIACLDGVPEAGAIAVVTFPKPLGGSGFPARVFAICPR